MIGANLVLVCQQTDCDEEVVIDCTGLTNTQRSVMSLVHTLDAEWPEGWGWDSNGYDEVLHCAEHRS